MSPRKIAFISLVVASILWATSGAVAKMLLVTFDPLSLGFIRLFIAGVLLLPFLLFHKHPPWKTLIRDCFPVALAGTGNFLFFLFGIGKTTANAAAIIYTATPILSMLLADITLHEKTGRGKFFGIVLGLLGVAVILLLPIFHRGQTINGDIYGNILIIFAVLSWTCYIVGSRRLIIKKQYAPIIITSTTICVSACIFFVALLLLPHRALSVSMLSGVNGMLLIYFAVFVTATTYIIHQWAIKNSSATTAAMTNYLQPIFALGFNAFLIGERLTPEFFAGSMLVLLGTFLATGGQIHKYLLKCAIPFKIGD